jgi:hypothetical protein
MYNSSLKYKWDNKNVLDYAVKEAKLEEAKEIARELKKMGMCLEDIAKGTKFSIEEIEKL